MAVNYGSSQTFTITPNTGYQVADVTVDGVSQGAITSYTFTNITVDHAIAASFAINAYTITATAGSGGTVAPATATINSGGSQSITITPNAGYNIADVTVDGVSQGTITSYTFTNITANHTIQAIFVANTITITIDSPSDGATINRPDVMVTGTVTNAGGYETGVIVNGVVAIVYGNQFVANHVPLQDGSNVITATATDVYETTSTASVTVNAATAGNFIRLSADTEMSVAPILSTLRIDGTFSIANSSLSVTGPVQPDVVTLSAYQYQVNITAEGMYFFTSSVTGPDGNTYQDTIGLGALNLTALDNLLRGRWNAMIASLANRDITMALTYISPNTKTIYQEMFTAISDQLPLMVATQIGLDLISVGYKAVVYKLKTLENGDVYAYQLTFVKDANGLWVIQDF